MIRGLLPAVAGVLALIGLSGCASGPLALPRDAEARRTETERRLIELERQAVKARIEQERLERRVAELEALSRPSRPAAPPAAAPAARPPVVEAPVAAPLSVAAWVEEDDLADDPPPGAPAGTPQAVYEAALALHDGGRAGEAESAFRAFLAAHPSSDLADNAWFWIGESRLSRQDPLGAAEAYRQAIERYPQGNKVPDALLKLGHALDLAGDAGAARAVWQELVQRFPTTAAAESARGRLGRR